MVGAERFGGTGSDGSMEEQMAVASSSTPSPARLVSAGLMAVALVMAGPTTSVAGPTTSGVGAPATQAAQDSLRPVGSVQAALRRDLGLSAAEVARLVQRQAAATRIDLRLRGQLSGAYGGSWFDHRTGSLTIGVTTAEAATVVAAAGADTVRVARGVDELAAIVSILDAVVAAAPAGSDGLMSWAVDPLSNQVVLTVSDPDSALVNQLVAAYGGALRVARAVAPPTLTSHGGEPFLDGGVEYTNLARGTICSTGFSLVTGGEPVVVTAGHCGDVGDLTSHRGTPVGQFVASTFPGADAARIRVDNPFWQPRAAVWTYPGTVPVVGVSDPPVGAVVCSSGRTTGVTCGLVMAKNETVVFPQGQVRNLTRHTACVEPGDSGGATYTAPGGSGVTGVGITTGAQLFNGRCPSRLGLQNVSWYYPLHLALR